MSRRAPLSRRAEASGRAAKRSSEHLRVRDLRAPARLVQLLPEELHDLEVVEDLGHELVDRTVVEDDVHCDVRDSVMQLMVRRAARRRYRAGTGLRSGLPLSRRTGLARSATLFR